VRLFFLVALACGCGGFHSVDDAGAPLDMSGPASAFTIVQELPDAGSLNAIWGSSANDVHAVGDNGMIYDYDGTTWTSVVGITGAKMGGVWGSGPTDIFAVGTLAAGATGLVEHNDGTGWIQQTELPQGLVSIWGSADIRWATGLNGQIYKMTAARSWYPLITISQNPYIAASMFSPILYSIWVNNANMILVAADVDTTVNFIGSSMWVPLYDPVDRTRTYRSVWGPPSVDPIMYLGANYFGVWWFMGKDNAFLLINEERNPGDENHFVWGTYGFASDRVIFVGDQGRIMTFDGGPNGVKMVQSPTVKTLSAVWASSPDDVWIVGDDALILHGAITF
jgi:hypothetical protein